jgi:integrase
MYRYVSPCRSQVFGKRGRADGRAEDGAPWAKCDLGGKSVERVKTAAMSIHTQKQAEAAGPGMHRVRGAVGLYLKKTGPSSGSWIYRFRLGGRRPEMGLGALADLSLVQARAAADKLKVEVRSGADPIAARRASKEESARARALTANKRTFAQAAEAYFEAHAGAWKHPDARRTWFNPVAKYAFPVIGQMMLDDIRVEHVAAVMAACEQGGAPKVAPRVRLRIEQILSAATALGQRSAVLPNPAGVKLVGAVRPAANKAADEHFRRLALDDAPAALRKLRELAKGSTLFAAWVFMIACATRPSEALNARWSEMDLLKLYPTHEGRAHSARPVAGFLPQLAPRRLVGRLTGLDSAGWESPRAVVNPTLHQDPATRRQDHHRRDRLRLGHHTAAPDRTFSGTKGVLAILNSFPAAPAKAAAGAKLSAGGRFLPARPQPLGRRNAQSPRRSRPARRRSWQGRFRCRASWRRTSVRLRIRRNPPAAADRHLVDRQRVESKQQRRASSVEAEGCCWGSCWRGPPARDVEVDRDQRLPKSTLVVERGVTQREPAARPACGRDFNRRYRAGRASESAAIIGAGQIENSHGITSCDRRGRAAPLDRSSARVAADARRLETEAATRETGRRERRLSAFRERSSLRGAQHADACALAGSS